MQQQFKLIPTAIDSYWNFGILQYYEQKIQKIAQNYGLDTYPNQIEIISAQQMIEACANIGMPINYTHWSFGKYNLSLENSYKKGQSGLAYELVINSNPCISYLMAENTLPLQVTIIAHACYGHNSFFKNNYLFTSNTNANNIIDFLTAAKQTIHKYEEIHGVEQVEAILDACHALKNCSIDTSARSPKQSLASLPEENILFFIEHNSKKLDLWQKDILRIVRTLAQYFYPQQQTKVMNEGWATFWHYTIINDMYAKKLIDDSFMLEFIHLHTEVIKQPNFDASEYYGLNPYNLGFKIFADIRRICENPTEEDYQWFPQLVNTNWLQSIHFAMQNFKDDSFIMQYLSPQVIRDLKLFALTTEHNKPYLEVTEIHDLQGYKKIRQVLASQYNRSSFAPNLQIVNVTDDGTLQLKYLAAKTTLLHDEQNDMLKYLYHLWGKKVSLEHVDFEDNSITISAYPMDGMLSEDAASHN